MHELDPTIRALLTAERAARLAADFAPRPPRRVSTCASARIFTVWGSDGLMTASLSLVAEYLYVEILQND